MRSFLTYKIEIMSDKTKEVMLSLLKEETDEQMLFIPDKKMNGTMKAENINVRIVLSKFLADPIKCKAIGKIESHESKRLLKLRIWPNWKFIFFTILFWWFAYRMIISESHVNNWIVSAFLISPFILPKIVTWIYGTHLENFLIDKLE